MPDSKTPISVARISDALICRVASLLIVDWKMPISEELLIFRTKYEARWKMVFIKIKIKIKML